MDLRPTPTPEPAIQVAARFLAEGRPAVAAERLAVLVAEAPTYAAAHVLHATALEAAGDPDGALEAWGRAASLVPRSPLVHRERERLLLAQRPPAPDAGDELPPAVPALGDDALDPLPLDDLTLEDLLAEDFLADTDEAADAHDPFADDEPGVPEAGAEEDPVTEATPGPAPAPSVLEGPYGDPITMGADDLFFGPPDASGPEPPEEPAPEEPAEPDPPPTREAAPDPWLPMDPETAPLLPPEEGASAAVPVVPETYDGAAAEDDGWSVMKEEDVPSPPPPAHAEPDVIPPEGDAPPAEAPPAAEPYAVADELDALISQLEDAPRIRPDPSFQGPSVRFEDDSADDLASVTLAQIYAAQHQYAAAALVYEKLAARQPDQADDLLRRAAEMRDRA